MYHCEIKKTENEKKFTTEELARLAHAMLDEYRAMLGQKPCGRRDELPDTKRKTDIRCMKGMLRTPSMDGETQHEEWLHVQALEGIRHGSERSDTTNPCFTHWEDLPEEEQMKSRLFVWAMRGIILGLRKERRSGPGGGGLGFSGVNHIQSMHVYQ